MYHLSVDFRNQGIALHDLLLLVCFFADTKDLLHGMEGSRLPLVKPACRASDPSARAYRTMHREGRRRLCTWQQTHCILCAAGSGREMGTVIRLFILQAGRAQRTARYPEQVTVVTPQPFV
jgi:hypothetical protein